MPMEEVERLLISRISRRSRICAIRIARETAPIGFATKAMPMYMLNTNSRYAVPNEFSYPVIFTCIRFRPVGSTAFPRFAPGTVSTDIHSGPRKYNTVAANNAVKRTS